MDIEQIKDEKIALEERLRILIDHELGQFIGKTGVSIESVSVSIRHYGVAGEPMDRLSVDGVTCRLAL